MRISALQAKFFSKIHTLYQMIDPHYSSILSNQSANTRLTEALKSVAITSAPVNFVGPLIIAVLSLILIWPPYVLTLAYA